jgi:hypothetical protein
MKILAWEKCGDTIPRPVKGAKTPHVRRMIRDNTFLSWHSEPLWP